VWPSSRYLPARVAAFREFLVEQLTACHRVGAGVRARPSLPPDENLASCNTGKKKRARVGVFDDDDFHGRVTLGYGGAWSIMTRL
jgi:hypothetical protein